MMNLTDLSKKIELAEQRSVMPGETGIQTRIYADQTLANITVVDGKETKKEIMLEGTNYWAMIALVTIQVFLVTMVYGPIAAFLVELFPTRIRYTSMSLPYHIGNGIFGGLTPFIATYLSGAFDDPLAGLWYPIGVAGICFVLGMFLLSNRKRAEVME
jgi:MHS family proline/betaine transporter-like MFS transporter